MTTTTEITADELREQISQHEQEAAEAEREIGVAVVDGKSPAAATKRAEQARERVTRCRAALEDLERRQAEAEEEARTGAASVERLASYEWMASYMELVENYLLRKAEFEAAEAPLKNMPIDNRFRRAKIGGRSHSDDESDLDTELLRAIPDPAEHRGKKGVRFPQTFTPDRARELRGFAEVRAEEERSGNGVDRSQPFGTWDRERHAERKAARQAAREVAETDSSAT
jgi:hypothetical protein